MDNSIDRYERGLDPEPPYLSMCKVYEKYMGHIFEYVSYDMINFELRSVRDA